MLRASAAAAGDLDRVGPAERAAAGPCPGGRRRPGWPAPRSRARKQRVRPGLPRQRAGQVQHHDVAVALHAHPVVGRQLAPSRPRWPRGSDRVIGVSGSKPGRAVTLRSAEQSLGLGHVRGRNSRRRAGGVGSDPASWACGSHFTQSHSAWLACRSTTQHAAGRSGGWATAAWASIARTRARTASGSPWNPMAAKPRR